MARWGYLLDTENARIHTKNVASMALATLLHKYGVRDKHVTAKAVAAINHLTRTWSSPTPSRASRRSATPPARQPRPTLMTFLRVGDVMSIQLGGHFHAAYVLQLHRDRGGTFPGIEFYAGRFDRIPAAEELICAAWRASTAGDGRPPHPGSDNAKQNAMWIQFPLVMGRLTVRSRTRSAWEEPQ